MIICLPISSHDHFSVLLLHVQNYWILNFVSSELLGVRLKFFEDRCQTLRAQKKIHEIHDWRQNDPSGNCNLGEYVFGTGFPISLVLRTMPRKRICSEGEEIDDATECQRGTDLKYNPRYLRRDNRGVHYSASLSNTLNASTSATCCQPWVSGSDVTKVSLIIIVAESKYLFFWTNSVAKYEICFNTKLANFIVT